MKLQQPELILSVLVQLVTLASSLILSDCERSIYYCCDPTSKSSELPKRCFEVNNCPGLYWAATDPCSEENVNRVERKVQAEEEAVAVEELLSLRRASIINNEILDYRAPVKKVPRKLILTTPSRVSNSKCAVAVANCCTPDAILLPMRCFERHSCTSVHWTQSMCSLSFIKEANRQISKSGKRRFRYKDAYAP